MVLSLTRFWGAKSEGKGQARVTVKITLVPGNRYVVETTSIQTGSNGLLPRPDGVKDSVRKGQDTSLFSRVCFINFVEGFSLYSRKGNTDEHVKNF